MKNQILETQIKAIFRLNENVFLSDKEILNKNLNTSNNNSNPINIKEKQNRISEEEINNLRRTEFHVKKIVDLKFKESIVDRTNHEELLFSNNNYYSNINTCLCSNKNCNTFDYKSLDNENVNIRIKNSIAEKISNEKTYNINNDILNYKDINLDKSINKFTDHDNIANLCCDNDSNYNNYNSNKAGLSMGNRISTNLFNYYNNIKNIISNKIKDDIYDDNNNNNNNNDNNSIKSISNNLNNNNNFDDKITYKISNYKLKIINEIDYYNKLIDDSPENMLKVIYKAFDYFIRINKRKFFEENYKNIVLFDKLSVCLNEKTLDSKLNRLKIFFKKESNRLNHMFKMLYIILESLVLASDDLNTIFKYHIDKIENKFNIKFDLKYLILKLYIQHYITRNNLIQVIVKEVYEFSLIFTNMYCFDYIYYYAEFFNENFEYILHLNPNYSCVNLKENNKCGKNKKQDNLINTKVEIKSSYETWEESLKPKIKKLIGYYYSDNNVISNTANLEISSSYSNSTNKNNNINTNSSNNNYLDNNYNNEITSNKQTNDNTCLHIQNSNNFKNNCFGFSNYDVIDIPTISEDDIQFNEYQKEIISNINSYHLAENKNDKENSDIEDSKISEDLVNNNADFNILDSPSYDLKNIFKMFIKQSEKLVNGDGCINKDCSSSLENIHKNFSEFKLNKGSYIEIPNDKLSKFPKVPERCRNDILKNNNCHRLIKNNNYGNIIKTEQYIKNNNNANEATNIVYNNNNKSDSNIIDENNLSRIDDIMNYIYSDQVNSRLSNTYNKYNNNITNGSNLTANNSNKLKPDEQKKKRKRNKKRDSNKDNSKVRSIDKSNSNICIDKTINIDNNYKELKSENYNNSSIIKSDNINKKNINKIKFTKTKTNNNNSISNFASNKAKNVLYSLEEDKEIENFKKNILMYSIPAAFVNKIKPVLLNNYNINDKFKYS